MQEVKLPGYTGSNHVQQASPLAGRMPEISRVLWSSSALTRLLRLGHINQVVQDCVQVALEYLQRERLSRLSGHPVPALSHPHSEKMFPDVYREPSTFQFVPTVSGPVTGHQ